MVDSPREGFAPTLYRRIVDYVVPLGGDPRIASVIGRLHFAGVLTAMQLEAGWRYAADVAAYDRLMGVLRDDKSAAFKMAYEAADEELERQDPDAAARTRAKAKRYENKVKKAFEKARTCIPAHPIVYLSIIEEACCNDREVSPVFYWKLQQMLSALAIRCYKLHDAQPKKPAKVRNTPADTTALAEGAVDAMEEHFRRKGWSLTAFRVQQRHEMQARVLTAYGIDRDKRMVEHEIRLKRPAGIKGAAIDKMLDAIAKGKGWPLSGAPQEAASHA